MKRTQRIKADFRKTIDSIKAFIKTPLNAAAHLIPIAMTLTALVGFVVALVRFATKGGFVNQVNLVKELGAQAGAQAGFTLGTVNIMFKRMVPIVVCSLLLLEIVVLVLSYFKTESKTKAIIATCCLGSGILLCLVHWYGFHLHYSYAPNKMPGYALINVLVVLAILGVLAVITFLILMLISQQRRDWLRTLMALVVSFGFFPLLLLFIENAVPLAVGILYVAIALIITVAVVMFAFFGFAFGSPSDTEGNSSTKTAKPKDEAAVQPPKDKNCAYIQDYNVWGGFKLYKVRGILHDYIAQDNGVASREVCSLDMLRNGTFKIYDAKSGRRITEAEIPWQR